MRHPAFYRRHAEVAPRRPPMKKKSSPAKNTAGRKPKITIIPGKSVSQAINYLLEDRDELEWLVAVGRNARCDEVRQRVCVPLTHCALPAIP